jgi:hypothetical protein
VASLDGIVADTSFVLFDEFAIVALVGVEGGLARARAFSAHIDDEEEDDTFAVDGLFVIAAVPTDFSSFLTPLDGVVVVV